MSVIFTKHCNNVYALDGQSMPVELKLDSWNFDCGDPDSVGMNYHPSFSKTVSEWETIKQGRFLLNVELGLVFQVVVCKDDGVEEAVINPETIDWNCLDDDYTEIVWSMDGGLLTGVAFFSFDEEQIDENHPDVLKLYYIRQANPRCVVG